MKQKTKDDKIYKYCLGLDIGSINRCGIALYDNENDKLVSYNTIYRKNSKNPMEHRNNVVAEIKHMLNDYAIDVAIFETVRLFAKGSINLDTIMSLCRLQTTIINEFSTVFDIYSVDVRSWKSRILGSASADKMDSVSFIHRKFPNVELIDEIAHPKKHTIEYALNHDLADAICLSMSCKYNKVKSSGDLILEKNKMNFK